MNGPPHGPKRFAGGVVPTAAPNDLLDALQAGLRNLQAPSAAPFGGAVQPGSRGFGPWQITQASQPCQVMVAEGARSAVEFSARAPFSETQHGTTQTFAQQGQVDVWLMAGDFGTDAQVLLGFSDRAGEPMWLSRASELLVYYTILATCASLRAAFPSLQGSPVLTLTGGGWHNVELRDFGTTF